MQRTLHLPCTTSRCACFHTTRTLHSKPIIQITKGTFYQQHPSSKSISGPNTSPNLPLFPNLNFSLPSISEPNEHWAILSPSSSLRTAFLQILRGQYICLPPTARSYPYLTSDEAILAREKSGKRGSRNPENAIQYVGFDVERRAMGGQYLSARYESRVESTDFTLGQYLTGIVGMNPGEEIIKERTPAEQVMRQVVKDLELERFFDKPVSTLSNGQSRRARIGKAILTQPEVLCLDAPFIGLDPFISKHISQLLHRLAEARAPRIVLSLRPQDVIPDWITHLVYANRNDMEGTLGLKEEVLRMTNLAAFEPPARHWIGGTAREDRSDSMLPAAMSRDGFIELDTPPEQNKSVNEPLVEMEGVRIKYGSNAVLGDWQQDIDGTSKDGLWWNVRRGERWGIFGANGSGKTTLLSLVTSDHPQTYSAPVKLFQRSRLPERGIPGITIFDIQSRMGHSSPEVHALFPKNLSVRRTLETAWSDTPITKPKMDTNAEKRVDACLKWFEHELHPPVVNSSRDEKEPSLKWADHFLFGGLTFSAQRVLLFLRATIRNPDIVILDEAFSGMDDYVRDKCLVFLSRGNSMPMENSDRPRDGGESEIANVVVSGLQTQQALLCVSHSEQEIPGCVREWICLPEPGTGAPRFGRWDGPLELRKSRWDEIWDWSIC